MFLEYSEIFKNLYRYPFAFFTCRTEVLEGLLQSQKSALDIRLSVRGLSPFLVSGFRGYRGSLCNSFVVSI